MVTSPPINLRVKGTQIFDYDNENEKNIEISTTKQKGRVFNGISNSLDLEWDSPDELNGSIVLEYVVKAIRY